MDPDTGAAAYMISGGGNGGKLVGGSTFVILGLAMLAMLGIVLALGFATVLVPFIIYSALAIISFGVEVWGSEFNNQTLKSIGCGGKWLFGGIGLGRLISLLPRFLAVFSSEAQAVSFGLGGIFGCL